MQGLSGDPGLPGQDARWRQGADRASPLCGEPPASARRVARAGRKIRIIE